jgi:Na+-translocating ferredoxin:NAD+ oxidoreductase RnfG subunit
MKIIFTLIITLLFSEPGSMRELYSKAADKNVASVLGTGDLKETGSGPGKEFYLFKSVNDNNGSHVVFSSAKGRYDNFDYMIILNSVFEILDIKILKYRSEYGYEIANKGWLKQFYGKPENRFEYRKDIDALTGATYSAPSLVDDINLILDHLRKNGRSVG